MRSPALVFVAGRAAPSEISEETGEVNSHRCKLKYSALRNAVLHPGHPLIYPRDFSSSKCLTYKNVCLIVRHLFRNCVQNTNFMNYAIQVEDLKKAVDFARRFAKTENILASTVRWAG